MSTAASEQAQHLFIKHLLPSFAELQSDKIVNVRLQVCQTLAQFFEKRLQVLCGHPKVVAMVRRLRRDSAKDAKHFLRKIELPASLASPEKDSQEEQEGIRVLLADSKKNMSQTEQTQLARARDLLDLIQTGGDDLLVPKEPVHLEQEGLEAEQLADQLLLLIYESALTRC